MHVKFRGTGNPGPKSFQQRATCGCVSLYLIQLSPPRVMSEQFQWWSGRNSMTFLLVMVHLTGIKCCAKLARDQGLTRVVPFGPL